LATPGEQIEDRFAVAFVVNGMFGLGCALLLSLAGRR
jgi:hypothetical protein